MEGEKKRKDMCNKVKSKKDKSVLYASGEKAKV